jgi:drug/metabolite transporter (DMT)-like permease
MMTQTSPYSSRHIWLLALGNLACCTSILFIKASTMHPVLLSSYRLIVAVAVLSPLFLSAWSKHREAFPAQSLRGAVIPGALLGFHFISWIMGARMTPAVNSTAIVNLIPLVSPALLFFFAGEKLNPREWQGSLVAFGGVVLITGRDYHLSEQYFWGDITCFTSMVLAACYLVLGRRNRHFPSVWLYLVPLYAVGSATCLVASFWFEPPFSVNYGWFEWGMVLGLGLVPTVIGHSLLNYSMRHLRGQIVGLSNFSQPLFAGALAFLFLDEVPDPIIFPAGILIAIGVTIALLKPSRSPVQEPAT